MANGQLLDELRELSKKEGNISAQAHRRITLAAIADIYEAQGDSIDIHTGFEERITEVEHRVDRQTKIELLISGLLGIIGINQ